MVAGQLITLAVTLVTVFIVMKIASKKQELAIRVVLFLFAAFMLSAGYVFFAYNVNLTSIDGVVDATKIYFSWVGNIFHNTVRVSGYAIHQDWGINTTVIENLKK